MIIIIIRDYNSTRSGVNFCDKMRGAYSVFQKTCRCPLSKFYTIINVARKKLSGLSAINIVLKYWRTYWRSGVGGRVRPRPLHG